METQSSLTPLTMAGRKLVRKHQKKKKYCRMSYAHMDTEAQARYNMPDAGEYIKEFQGAGTRKPEDSHALEWNAPDEAEEYVDNYYFGGAESGADQVKDLLAAAQQEYDGADFSWGPAFDLPAEARE